MGKTLIIFLSICSIALFGQLKFIDTFYDNVKTIVIEQTTAEHIKNLFGKPDEITSENKHKVWEYESKNKSLLIKFNNENKVYAYSYKINNTIAPNKLELNEARNINPYVSTERKIYQSFGQPTTIQMTSSSINFWYLNKENQTVLSVELANKAPYIVKHFQYSSKHNDLQEINSTSIEKLIIEETTIDDVTRLFGNPNEIKVFEKGEYWSYNSKSAMLVLNFKKSENSGRIVLSKYRLHK